MVKSGQQFHQPDFQPFYLSCLPTARALHSGSDATTGALGQYLVAAAGEQVNSSAADSHIIGIGLPMNRTMIVHIVEPELKIRAAFGFHRGKFFDPPPGPG